MTSEWNTMANCMNLNFRETKQAAYFCGLALAFASPISAQERNCGRSSIRDARLPTYPPIARAAHMEATLRFRVSVRPRGTPLITLLEGPNQGVWQILVTNAHDYLAARTYEWFEGSRTETCNYVATVEYRIIPGNVSAPNNFMRITVLDELHTLVEVKPTIPTANY